MIFHLSLTLVMEVWLRRYNFREPNCLFPPVRAHLCTCSVAMFGWLFGGKGMGEKNHVIRKLHSTSTCFFLLIHLCRHDCSSFHLPDKVDSLVVLQHNINCVHNQPRCLHMLPYKQMLHKMNTMYECSEVFLTFIKVSAKIIIFLALIYQNLCFT